MSWEDQGRQEHGWFGHGTSGKTDADDGRFQRIVFGVIGNLPAALRSRWDGMLSQGLAGRTASVLRGLSEASGLEAEAFLKRLPDTVGNIAAGRIQAAADVAATAHTPDDERAASAALADVVQAVGLDGWSRLLAGVEQRTADSGQVVPAQAIEIVPRLFTEPPEEIIPRNMERIPGKVGRRRLTTSRVGHAGNHAGLERRRASLPSG